LISDALLPLEWLIPYQDCLLSIQSTDREQVAAQLYTWLNRADDDQLRIMCRTARTVWETFFAPNAFQRMIRLVLEHHRNNRETATVVCSLDHAQSVALAAAAHDKIRQSDYSSAHILFQEAIKANPREAVLYNDLGVALLQLG
jgi:hypothetical protein